ncbi:hypothetical protein RYX36_010917 [Vicia faba]
MVFSSIPSYLDPLNWQQQPNQHQLLPPLSSQPHGAGSIIRPGSIPNQVQGQGQAQTQASQGHDIQTGQTQTQAQTQTQIVKLPQPETALKCPRCESNNTKFCYYNNYNLSQPRHFCKTCRRYWTRGGALRNVPVGGGCRRSKKTKKSNTTTTTTPSKSSISNSNEKDYSTSAIHSTSSPFGEFLNPSNKTYMNMTSLQNLSRYGVGNVGNMGFQIGDYSGGGEGGGVVDQWRFQQFPFMNNGFESTISNVSFPFQSEIVEPQTSSRANTQMPASIKSENNLGLNFLRSSLNLSENNNNHYNSWPDFSGLASSSASRLL